MSNDISKRYSFTIDTKDSKTLNNGLSFNHGDDITLIIKVIEDLQPKSLTNCSVDLIIANQSQEFPIIHRYSDGGITILDDTVTIITKSNYINLIGVNVAQLLISDEDQTITTQPFAFTTISTLLSDDMVGAVDKIDTLVELDKVIEETRSKITLVDGEITRLSQMASTVKNDIESLSESLTNKVQTVITNTDSIVSGVIRDEEQRKLNENTRITSEQERVRNEQARRDAEIQRNNRENTRISSENERLASERDRISAEISRSTSEISRNSAENERDNAESERVSNESSRMLAETDRSSAETQRVTNETSREKAETARSSAETTRLQNENSRFTAEKNRIAAETERANNESSRKTAESNRVSAETTRNNNETARSTAETERQESESLRVIAETERIQQSKDFSLKFETFKSENDLFKTDMMNEYGNAKFGYYGDDYGNVVDRLNNDFDIVHQKIKDTSIVKYEGVDIQANESNYGLINSIKIKGKTFQNLVEFDNIRHIGSAMGTMYKSGNTIKVTSTKAGSSVLCLETKLIQPSKTYTIIVNVKSVPQNTESPKLTIGYFNGSGWKSIIDLSLGLNKICVLTPSNCVYLYIGNSSNIFSEANQSYYITGLAILAGDKSTTDIHEIPLVHGIKSLGEYDISENGTYKVTLQSCCKNLFNMNDWYSFGDKCTSNVIDGNLYINCVPGQSNKTIQYRFPIGKKLRSGSIYTFSGSVISSSNVETCRCSIVSTNYDTFSTSCYIPITGGSFEFKINITKDINYHMVKSFDYLNDLALEFNIESTDEITDSTIILKDVQIERAPAKTNYEPFEEQSVVYELTQPLRSVGDICDEIIDDMLIRRIGVRVVNGREYWVANGYGGHSTLNTFEFSVDIQSNTSLSVVPVKCLSNQFSGENTTMIPSINSFRISRNNREGRDYFLFSPSTSMIPYRDTASWITWLKNNNVIVYYVMNEPIVEYLTPKYLKSYNDTTHISCSDIVSPIIQCGVYTNLANIVSKLLNDETEAEEKEIQNIEINLDQDLRLTMLELGVM